MHALHLFVLFNINKNPLVIIDVCEVYSKNTISNAFNLLGATVIKAMLVYLSDSMPLFTLEQYKSLIGTDQDLLSTD